MATKRATDGAGGAGAGATDGAGTVGGGLRALAAFPEVPGFKSQNSHGCPQSSSGLLGHQGYTWRVYIRADKTYRDIQ